MKKLAMAIILLGTAVYADDVYATFRVEADQSAELAFSSSGIVDKVNIDVGSVVKQGDILASLQNDDLKALTQSAVIAETYAKKDFDRQEKVKNVIDEAQYDQYAFKYENAKAQAAYQKAMLDKTELKAPFDGVVFEKIVEVGDTVSGAMIHTVLKVQSLHERKLVLSFDQKYHGVVKAGDTFKYKVDGDETMYEGKISKIYPSVDADNRKVTAEVETKDLMVGLFGEGMIETAETEAK